MTGNWIVRFGVLVVLAMLAVNLASANPQKANLKLCALKGVVSEPTGTVSGAVVQLRTRKPTNPLFVTKERGEYFFTGLSPDVDYEVKAESQGMSSPARNVSSFDSVKVAIRDLKLAAK
jgi:hypothetical protein